MKRNNVFAITENSETHYNETKTYGLAGVALRFCLNAQDENGEIRPLISRLDKVKKVNKEDWQKIADKPHLADKYFSFIEINADKNIVCSDEDGQHERRYIEVPLDKLLETAMALIERNKYTGYPSLNKVRLDSYLKRYSNKYDAEKASVLEQIRTGLMSEGNHSEVKRKTVDIDRN